MLGGDAAPRRRGVGALIGGTELGGLAAVDTRFRGDRGQVGVGGGGGGELVRQGAGTAGGCYMDRGAALFGGVSGHAGLFSNARDLAVIMEMLIDGGVFNGKRFLSPETIRLFTTYHSPISRRGYGFDKPEKDNATRKEAYPCLSNSPLTFGHTGYTGTGVWADPAQRLVFIFLSNRVNPEGGDVNKKLLNMNVRGNIMEAVYRAMKD